MQCDICLRAGGHRLPFLCPTDARNLLYEGRIENARILLDKDSLDRQITVVTSRRKTTEHSEETPKCDLNDKTSKVELDRVLNERNISEDRTQQIIAQADKLRAKIEEAKSDIERKRTLNARRKSDLASATNGLESRRARQVDEIERKVKIMKYKWNHMHGTTAHSRAFLSGEAAKLYGLCRVVDNDVLLDEYSIAGMPIVDLRAMNSVSAAQITTSLSHIAHLLVLSAHYLSLRLPAEVTLPHRDYPLPTVLSIPSSYTYTNIPFPGSTPVHSTSNSPSASRHAETANLPRPRPLFITKPLPLLAKEDPVNYSLFLEGATLLAYNIAWVCKSQGVTIGSSNPTSFEDICTLGRNLFNLLIGTSPRPSPGSRVPSTSSTPASTTTSTPTKFKNKNHDSLETNEPGSEDHKRPSKDVGSLVGHFSHGTAHTFLGSTEGNEFVRSFRLPSPLKLTDSLRAQLLSELSSAEWEIVDQDAWAEHDRKELEDEGVLVGARREIDDRPARPLGGGLGRFGGAMQSFMSMRTVMDAVEIVGSGGDGARNRKPGTSGWTKVKSR